MSYLVIVAFLAIALSLGAALFFMLRGGDTQETEASATKQSKAMARALAFRIGLSVLVFLCVLIAWQLGYIQPTGIRSGQ